MAAKARSAFRDKKIVARALKDSILKLNPKTQVKNPVMLLVFLSAILTTGLWIVSLFGIKDAPSGYTLAIAVILWFTALFANFAEAIAEGRGKAQVFPPLGDVHRAVVAAGDDHELGGLAAVDLSHRLDQGGVPAARVPVDVQHHLDAGVLFPDSPGR